MSWVQSGKLVEDGSGQVWGRNCWGDCQLVLGDAWGVGILTSPLGGPQDRRATD